MPIPLPELLPELSPSVGLTEYKVEETLVTWPTADILLTN